jgi:hypothetical protein
MMSDPRSTEDTGADWSHRSGGRLISFLRHPVPSRYLTKAREQFLRLRGRSRYTLDMALRDLLVYVDQSEHASQRLRLAGDLACRHKSRLTALYVRELNPAQRHEQSIAELGQGSSEAITRTNHCRI